MTQDRHKRKQRIGIVVSDKMNKTRIVKSERLTRHPKYLRVVKKSTSYKVHDEENTSRIGDKVRIAETRRLSKDKRWRLVEIISAKEKTS